MLGVGFGEITLALFYALTGNLLASILWHLLYFIRKNWPLQSTIAYREYVSYRDSFALALRSATAPELPRELIEALLAINYIGKRGGFVQLTERPAQLEDLPGSQFFELTLTSLRAFPRDGTLQMLDDCATTLTFQKVNIYSGERITAGKGRILRHVVLPYQLFRSSRSYSWYRLLSQDQQEQGE